MKSFCKVLGLAMAFGVLVDASAANADGFIARNIIKPLFGEHAAREADKLHEQVGKPLDKVVPIVAGTVAETVLGAKK